MSTQSARPPPVGMPILSGPPPVTESSNCRQCDKPFNILLRRAHVCGHCGYEYCSTCIADGQALMPRRASSSTNSSTQNGASSFFNELRDGFKEVMSGGSEESSAPGYEVEEVCLHCISMLRVTAAPVKILRSLPLKRLKDYLAAYDIPLESPKEKEDFVQAVIKARNPLTGCLSPVNESYYRRKSVPKGGQPPPQPSNARPTRPTTNNTGRPTPAPPRPQQPTFQQARPPPTSNSQYRPHSTPQQQYRPPTSTPPRPTPARPPTASNTTSANAHTPTRQPSPPVPTILSLVSLPRSYLASLSIGTLKAILYENHVRVDFSQVLEKEELISRVFELVTDERKRLERQRIEEEKLSAPLSSFSMNKTPSTSSKPSSDLIPNGDSTKSAEIANGENGSATEVGGNTDGSAKIPTGPQAEVERGLCVVCQDEEATLAVVDCGHLCMCAHCSDLILATSKECPLCRTRIVTPQRLIRIYRV